jgi:hypothetical protein
MPTTRTLQQLVPLGDSSRVLGGEGSSELHYVKVVHQLAGARDISIRVSDGLAVRVPALPTVPKHPTVPMQNEQVSTVTPHH